MNPITLPLLQKYWHLVECLEYDKKQSKWIVRDLQPFEVDPMPVLSFTKEELQGIKKLDKKQVDGVIRLCKSESLEEGTRKNGQCHGLIRRIIDDKVIVELYRNDVDIARVIFDLQLNE